MPKYKVYFTPQALKDILASYEWGLVAWGEAAAGKWIRKLHEIVYRRLSAFPNSCPLAPESPELEADVRQLVFLRYRVLFEVKKRQVIVLRVEGPYTGRPGV